MKIIKLLIFSTLFSVPCLAQSAGPVAAQDGAATYIPAYCSHINGVPILCPSKIQDSGTQLLYNGVPIPSGTSTTTTVASGTVTLNTAAIGSGACDTVVTATGTGVATTDAIIWGFNADPTSTTGYAPAAGGILVIIPYPTSGHVNFKVCNNTGLSITPGAAVTLNWRVVR
jgi:hypothetical protein